MHGTIDAPAGDLPATLENGAVAAGEVAVFARAHPVLLPIDRGLPALDMGALTRCQLARGHATVDWPLLIRITLADRLRVRDRTDQAGPSRARKAG
jgi:hypothetical protein